MPAGVGLKAVEGELSGAPSRAAATEEPVLGSVCPSEVCGGARGNGPWSGCGKGAVRLVLWCQALGNPSQLACCPHSRGLWPVGDSEAPRGHPGPCIGQVEDSWAHGRFFFKKIFIYLAALDPLVVANSSGITTGPLSVNSGGSSSLTSSLGPCTGGVES